MGREREREGLIKSFSIGSSLPKSAAQSRHHRCAAVQFARGNTGDGHGGFDGMAARLQSLLEEGEKRRTSADARGHYQVDEEQKPMNFTQTFQLMPEGGSYFIFNDLFKLVYPA